MEQNIYNTITTTTNNNNNKNKNLPTIVKEKN